MISLWIALSAIPAVVVPIVLVKPWKGAQSSVRRTWRSKNCPSCAQEVELIC